MDAKNKIAPANSNYTKRLNNIAKALGNEVNGTACKEMDAKNKIAPANSNYTKRLNNIAKALGNEV
ncbi:hypothetical protein BUE67_16125, partial [Corynebacterium diphtheriae]